MNRTLPRPRAEATTPFERLNPLARLGGSLVISLPHLWLFDLRVAAGTITVSLVVAVLLTDLPLRRVAGTSSVLVLAAVSAGLANALGTAASSVAERADVGATTAGRVLALVLPGALTFATIDPVDAASAAVRQLRLPVRGAYGVLAAVRLIPLLVDEWRLLGSAERARGVAGQGAPDAVRRWVRRTLALLVAALRRAGRVSLALEARGFDSMTAAAAGDSPWRVADTLCLLAAVALAAGTVLVAGLIPG